MASWSHKIVVWEPSSSALPTNRREASHTATTNNTAPAASPERASATGANRRTF
jgi:hypothetical protein